MLRLVFLKRQIVEQRYDKQRKVIPVSDQAYWLQDAKCSPFLANAY